MTKTVSEKGGRSFSSLTILYSFNSLVNKGFYMVMKKKEDGASQSERHCYAVIGLASGIAHMIEEDYKNRDKNKTVLKYTKMIRERAKPCFYLWSNKLTDKQKQNIDNRIYELEKMIVETKAPIVVLTSMMLSMLSDMRKEVGRRKHRKIDSLLSAYNQFHYNYDKRMDRWDAYDLANELVKEFYKIPA